MGLGPLDKMSGSATARYQIYYEGLGHVIMEAEKFHDLPYVSWRPRKAGSVILVQTRRLENQRSQWSVLV